METSKKKTLGYTDEVTECDCCGKHDLKGTYAVSLNGEVSYFGSVCAFKIHAVSYEDQKEMKKERKARVKAVDKFAAMEAAYNGTQYALVKMLKFVEAHTKCLDLNAFILKYGRKIDEMNFANVYEVGYVVRYINK